MKHSEIWWLKASAKNYELEAKRGYAGLSWTLESSNLCSEVFPLLSILRFIKGFPPRIEPKRKEQFTFPLKFG